MKCPNCGEMMINVSGQDLCPVCDMFEDSMNKTMDDNKWSQGDKDDSSED